MKIKVRRCQQIAYDFQLVFCNYYYYYYYKIVHEVHNNVKNRTEKNLELTQIVTHTLNL